MGRRWGKTTTAGSLALACANRGAAVAWVVPTYKNSRPVWRFAENAVMPLVRSGSVRINRSERMVYFPRTGGWMGVYTAENDTGLRGEKFDLVVGDEAARFSEETVEDVIEATLADNDGEAYYISTPAGRNWFWRKSMAAKEDMKGDGRFQSAYFHAPTYANPHPNIRRAYLLARKRLPHLSFAQEWDAEFIEDGAGVFQGVLEAMYPVQPREYRRWLAETYRRGWYPEKPFGVPYRGTFVMGVDWGKLNDFTVLVVIDVATRRVVDVVRYNKISWHSQRDLLRRTHEKWNCQVIWAEDNSMGDVNIEELQALGLPVVGFETTNASKKMIVERLAVDIADRKIWMPDILEVREELLSFGMTKTPSGLIRYEAPSGVHDDIVIALSIANYAASSDATTDMEELEASFGAFA